MWWRTTDGGETAGGGGEGGDDGGWYIIGVGGWIHVCDGHTRWWVLGWSYSLSSTRNGIDSINIPARVLPFTGHVVSRVFATSGAFSTTYRARLSRKLAVPACAAVMVSLLLKGQVSPARQLFLFPRNWCSSSIFTNTCSLALKLVVNTHIYVYYMPCELHLPAIFVLEKLLCGPA